MVILEVKRGGVSIATEYICKAGRARQEMVSSRHFFF